MGATGLGLLAVSWGGGVRTVRFGHQFDRYPLAKCIVSFSIRNDSSTMLLTDAALTFTYLPSL